jgi:asparagine synthase (glutamine-hydrolysing)
MDRTRDILDALTSAVKELVGDNEVALLFSGGLDSSVIARITAKWSLPRLYTVGVEGAHDLRVAEHTAASLDLPWVGLVIEDEDIMRAIAPLSRLISTRNPLTISFEMPLYFVAKSAGERLMMSGQGADEIFGGYARYLNMSPDELEENMEKDSAELIDMGTKFDNRIAGHFGKKILHPYLHPMVIEVAKAIPVTEHIRNAVRKTVLREVGTLLGLGEIAMREKKAAQYGSGIMKTMKTMAKQEGMMLGAFVESLVAEGENP